VVAFAEGVGRHRRDLRCSFQHGPYERRMGSADPASQNTVPDGRSLEEIVQRAGIVLFSCAADPDRLRYISRNAEQFGHRPEELVGAAPPLHLLHDEDAQRLLLRIAECRDGGCARLTDEVRIITRSGEARWCRLSLGIRRNARGLAIAYDGVLIDISAHKLTEEAHRALQHQVQAVLDAIPLPIFYKDTELLYLGCNRAFAEITGLPREKIVGQGVNDVWLPELAAKYDEMDRALLNHPSTQVYEHRLRSADGSIREVKFHKATCPDQAGRVAGVVGVVLDVSERNRAWRELEDARASLENRVQERTRELEQVNVELRREIEERARIEDQLRESDRRKDEFLAILSHELRNPLTAIRYSHHILANLVPVDERAKRALTALDRNASALTLLLDDLLDLTRISRGKVRLQSALLDLNELTSRAAGDQRPMFTARKVRLDVKLPTEPVPVLGDAARLEQVVGNLLQNAAKFTEPGGSVLLSLAREPATGTPGRGTMAVLRVRDTGIGIEPKMLEQIFLPFTQAEQSLARTGGGLGLGLALVKALVEVHGGTVQASSEGLGNGAEFVVQLPLQQEERLAATSAAPEAEGKLGRRVLVIDDNVDIAECLREALELGGHEVEVAYTGAEGLAKARSFRAEVVLCDIGLPVMDGYQVAQAFRADEALRDVYLVAVSGYALPADVERATKAGFNHHMAKPVSIEQLEEVLAHAEGLQ
jgi:PAS domain S-box-containing protein